MSESATTSPAAEGPPPTPRRHRFLVAVLGVFVVAAVASPWWGPHVLSELSYFRVRRVEVRGARYIAASDILRRLNVDTTSSVWQPTAPLESRVAAHPGIRRAHVRRRLPGTLVVQVDESVPVALVPGPSGFRAYDQHGIALPIDLTRVPVDAPIARQRDTSVFRLLGQLRAEAPVLYQRLDEVRPGARRDELTMRLDSISLRVMTDVTPTRLRDVEPVEQDLARRRVRAAELDLRFRDQVIARLP
jgi:cell division protein FtsQ